MYCLKDKGKKRRCPYCKVLPSWIKRFDGDDRDRDDPCFQDDFAEAYVTSLAACCGLIAAQPGKDRFGYDRRIEPTEFSWSNGAELRLQIKSLFQPEWKKNSLCYNLGPKKYERLRRPQDHLPLLVVVAIEHAEVENWATCEPDLLKLNAVAYFSVIPYTKYEDRSEKGIRIHRGDMLTNRRLFQLLHLANQNERKTLERIRKGERLWDPPIAI